MFKQRFLYVLLIILVVSACKETTNTPIPFEPEIKKSLREAYAAKFAKNDSLLFQWQQAFKKTQTDSLRITLPYVESGVFTAKNLVASSYTFQLRTGENFNAVLQNQTDSILVFLDLFRKTEDAAQPWILVKSAPQKSNTLSHTVDAYGFYKVVVQAEIKKTAPFQLQLYTQPMYRFPISGTHNKDVKSFWAANRGEGKRTHEGIDIYANKGTPVIALANGRITSTADGELGGKQIWLEDKNLGTSLYYAHLDKVLTKTNAIVAKGDTIGLVGNTGNAKDLDPHLHFGVFLGTLGPVDPYPYIKETEIPAIGTPNLVTNAIVLKNNTTVHQGPSLALETIATLEKGDTIPVLATSGAWFRVMHKNDGIGFVQVSAVEGLNN